MYEKLLKPYRLRESTISERTPIEEFYSDRSRIIYSSSFRRLQQKAQVFSLEPNSNVRTRLVHSIEVSDIGRSLANNICNKLLESKILSNETLQPQIVAIVENACLLHDIGNPPFGHFGEAAIKNWVNSNIYHYAGVAGIGRSSVDKFVHDFYEFDGNPQGLRTITRLHCEQDEYGLNLTAPTILSGIKYPRKAGGAKDDGNRKKAGYFLSEEVYVNEIYAKMEFDINCKYPLSYIMEAADDISYCLSDISDGIKKKVITLRGFLEDFADEWSRTYPYISIPDFMVVDDHEYFNLISVKWSRAIMQTAVDQYTNNHDSIMQGKIKDLIGDSNCGKVLEIIKSVSRKRLYRSDEAENIELSGYSVINGLLNHFGKLLLLSRNKFEILLDDLNLPKGKGLDLEWRILNRISRRIISSYKQQLDKALQAPVTVENKLSYDDIEWWLRVHMIIDHISGMTDAFALQTYQKFEGIIRV